MGEKYLSVFPPTNYSENSSLFTVHLQHNRNFLYELVTPSIRYSHLDGRIGINRDVGTVVHCDSCKTGNCRSIAACCWYICCTGSRNSKQFTVTRFEYNRIDFIPLPVVGCSLIREDTINFLYIIGVSLDVGVIDLLSFQ